MKGWQLYLVVALVSGSASSARAQSAGDTLVVSPAEAETIFLQRNLRLLASRLDIDEANAKAAQAKLWPNPTLSIGEINLWANEGAEDLGRLLGRRGNHSQVAVAVDQLIQTAGKRHKLMAVAQAGAHVATLQFEDLLRNLSVEFRTHVARLYRAQRRLATYGQSLVQLRMLLQGYQRRAQQGDVSQSEYMRLRASEAELVKKITDITKDEQYAQQALNTMMGVAPPDVLVLQIAALQDVPVATLKALHATTLLEWVETNNTKLMASQSATTQAQHQLSYERAQRVPDLTFSVNYDRGGNIMRNFIGAGISIDIPLLNRNQGNIRAAQAVLAKSQLETAAERNEVGHAAINVWRGLLLSIHQQDQLGPHYEADMDRILEGYHRSFGQRHISLLEYLDFLDAYLDTKDHILENIFEIHTQFEALQYYVGHPIP